MVDVPKHANLEDVAKDTGFWRFYKTLPEKSSSTVRIFDRKNYYTVHGSDATLAAETLLKVTVKTINNFDSAWLAPSNYELFIKELLLVKSYRVEVYTEEEDGWTLTARASPGNLIQLEDVLFNGIPVNSSDGPISSGICSLILKPQGGGFVIGVAFCDTILQKLKIAQIIDDLFMTKLQVLLVQLSPKEMLIPSAMEKGDHQILQLLKRNRIHYYTVKNELFSGKDVVQDLNRIYKFKAKQSKDVSILPELQLDLGKQALGSLIKYLELCSSNDSFNQYTLEKISSDSMLRIDSSAVQALNLLPTSSTVSKNDTIYGILCNARTPGGQRLLAEWIKQPLTDKNLINERLDVVEEFVNNSELRGCLSTDILRRFPDLSHLAKKFHLKKFSLADIYKLYTIVGSLPLLCDQLMSCTSASVRDMFSQPCKQLVEDFSKFTQMVEQVLDLDRASEKQEYLILPSFDEGLQELATKITDLERAAEKALTRAAQTLRLEKHKVIKLDYSPDGAYVFRVGKKEDKVISGDKSFTIVDVKNNGISFNNLTLDEINSEYLPAKKEYKDCQKTLESDIVDVASGYAEPLYRLAELVDKVDALVGLSVAAVNGNYKRPEILDMGSPELILKGLRHPIVEQREGQFVANDCHFKRDEKQFYILTGPNMGGKSTYMRSIGVAVVMAQIGSFVACEEAHIPICDAVLTRVGAGDEIISGVSTFMAEMIESAFILRTATKHSLIVIDELGRGTSTYDGFGLAWAISKHLASECGSFCIFATHYHELTVLEESEKAVKNIHVTAHLEDDKLTLLYKIHPGVCSKSFGVQVAELAKIPDAVIEKAKSKLDEYRTLDMAIALAKQDAVSKEAEECMQKFVQEAKAIINDENIDNHMKNSKISEMKKRLCDLNNPILNNIINIK